MPILIILGVIFASFVLYKGYSIIQQNGEYKSVIAVQNETIKNKEKTIDQLKMDVVLRDNILIARDVQMDVLRERLSGITDDLGNDSEEQAPNSLKELVRRLKK